MAYDPINEDIKVFAIGPNYNRFQVALDIQNACNPSGVARELVRVIHSAMHDPKCTGTDWVRNDPAVILVVDKLHDLMGRRDAWVGFPNPTERCRELAGGRQSE